MNEQNKNHKIVVILDNIRSVHNIGAIFRTSDALGISKIYLCGITPCPIDRFGRERSDLHKSALGAEKSVSWEYFSSTIECVMHLKNQGYTVVSIEQSKNSVDYKSVIPKNKTAFVFGNEVSGVTEDVLSTSDQIAEVPMLGQKESLNVSVTFGIVMFRVLDK